MKSIKLTEWKYPKEWPPEKFFKNHSKITDEQAKILENLIENRANETTIDKFLRDNPNILVHCLRSLSTGHHGAWVIPQQTIRSSMAGVTTGLIPDYIIGGKSSDGFEWFVLELKGANQTLFVNLKKTFYLSSVANKAICQTLEYIDYCSSIQSHLRDSFKLTDFREPKGLILIGREDEFSNDERRKALKSAWNRYMGNKVEIRTYDSMLRHVRTEINLNKTKDNR